MQMCPLLTDRGCTVGRLLKEMKYSLKAKQKKIGAGNDPDRNEQFEYISRQRKQAAAEGIAVISVEPRTRSWWAGSRRPGPAGAKRRSR